MIQGSIMAEEKSEFKKSEDTLKALRKQEEENAVVAYKAKMSQDREAIRAAQLEALNKALCTYDENGNIKSNAWNDAISRAEDIINQETTGYNSEWKLAMLNLLTIFSLLTKAVNGTLDTELRLPLTELVVDKGILALKDYLTIGPPSEISLPSLEYNVGFTDNNELKIAPLLRSDLVQDKGTDLDGKGAQLDEQFGKGIVRWLKDNGYTPSPADKSKFVDKQGSQLDKATFEKLKEDPQNGLSNFLKEESNLVYTPHPGSTSV